MEKHKYFRIIMDEKIYPTAYTIASHLGITLQKSDIPHSQLVTEILNENLSQKDKLYYSEFVGGMCQVYPIFDDIFEMYHKLEQHADEKGKGEYTVNGATYRFTIPAQKDERIIKSVKFARLFNENNRKNETSFFKSDEPWPAEFSDML